VTAAAIGCLISWAREAVSSPIVVTLFMCARSARFLRNRSRSSSARLRSVTSITVPDEFNEIAGWTENGMGYCVDVPDLNR